MPDIQYYVVRQGEAQERFVPMVPIDQLPDWLDVVGVPRELPVEDAAKMTALLDLGRRGGLGGTFEVQLLMDTPGEAPSESDTGTGHAVKSAAPTAPLAVSSPASVTSAPSSHVAAGDEACDREHDVKQAHTSAEKTAHLDPSKESISTAEDPDCWKHEYQATDPVVAKDVPKTTAKNEAPHPAEDSPSCTHEDPSTKHPVLPCKFWCKHGRCGYNPRCRFAHIMPLTREGLHAVDLDDLPRWYIKKSGRRDCDKKKHFIADSQSSSSHGGTPTARRKPYKKQKITAATASYTAHLHSTKSTPAPSETHKSETAVPVATAGAMEVDDLIELI